MDLFRVLREDADTISALVEDLKDKGAVADDEFSVTGHICHLRDLERDGYRARIEAILTQDNPLLQNFDGTAVARVSNYDAEDVQDALQVFLKLRERNIVTLEHASSSQLQRVGHYDGRPPINLIALAKDMLEHDADHIARLRRLSGAVAFGSQP